MLFNRRGSNPPAIGAPVGFDRLLAEDTNASSQPAFPLSPGSDWRDPLFAWVLWSEPNASQLLLTVVVPDVPEKSASASLSS